MLKPIFDEDVDFFSKKIILCAKGGDFTQAKITIKMVKYKPTKVTIDIKSAKKIS